MSLIVREDVSQIPPQGGYVAKRCPVRVAFDVSPPPGAVPLESSAAARARMHAGTVFEATLIERLAGALGEAVVELDHVDSEERERATAHAMATGQPIIAGGRLPTDRVGRRAGEPDLLVRGAGGYFPIAIKHHKTVRDLRKKTPDPLRRARNPLHSVGQRSATS